MNSCIKDYKDLLGDSSFMRALNSNSVCLFIGAGVGRNLGMPDWNGLAKKITNYCAYKSSIKHSMRGTLDAMNEPLKVISYCLDQIETYKEQEIGVQNLLNEVFVTGPRDKYNTSKVYKDLVEIINTKKALLVQTNYDSVIEKNLNFKVQPYVPYLNSPNIPINNDLLVYLHGKYDGQNVRELVLTRKHYNDVYVLEKTEQFEKQKNFIKKLLHKYHIIILGYSLQDVELLQLMANKGTCEDYVGISVIIDSCEAKSFSNEIEARYWELATEGKINVYKYSTEDNGFKEFETVIDDLKQEFMKEPPKAIINYKYEDIEVSCND